MKLIFITNQHRSLFIISFLSLQFFVSQPVCAQEILPVMLTNFSLVRNSTGQIVINWTVDDEQFNHTGYYIQHSPDGHVWKDLGFQPSAGDKSFESYSFTHIAPVNGKNYYRLKWSSNTAINYSEIKTITVQSNSSVTTWPNPVKDILHLQTEAAKTDHFNTSIFDQSGRPVMNQSLGGSQNTIDLSALPQGTYFLHIQLAGGEYSTQKLIKL